ncbi:MAG TPA: nucleotide pyrophosphatase, partial [Candidatus Latescibacteria bacterium]|nr:nucleotide pyrophosphatase [Candidatus Latescibacterota bacterium]
MGKIFVIGLDAAPPKLVFEDFRDELPNLAEMMDHGVYGPLESCDPPITIPAWAVMTTSRNPGTLGLYGFRHRKKGSYTEFYIASSLSVREETIWDILSREGLKSCVVGVPPSYPPKPLNGLLVSCFITPDATKEYTYPPSLKREVERLVGEYMFDVKFRTEER